MRAVSDQDELDFSVSVGVAVNNPLPGATPLHLSATSVNASLAQHSEEVLSMADIPVQMDHITLTLTLIGGFVHG